MSGSYALLRLGLLAAAVVFSAASGSPQSSYRAGPAPSGEYTPPAPQPMEATAVVGLYRSSFGPVKIELDAQQGAPYVAGVWVYEREAEEVIGLFEGQMNGNVLEFRWQEPSAGGAPLMGNGFLVFHSDGTGFYGKWWTTSRDRTGDWNGQKYRPGEPADAPTDDQPEPEPEYLDEQTI